MALKHNSPLAKRVQELIAQGQTQEQASAVALQERDANLNKKTTTVQKDSFDDLMFDGMQESPQFKNLTGQNPGAVQDVFNTMYKMDPKLGETQAPQKNLMESLLNLPEYKSLHTTTQMDSVSSALSTLKMAPAILEQLQKIHDQQQERQKQKQKNKSQESSPGIPGVPDSVVAEGSEEGSLDDSSPADQAAMRRALREAAEEAQKDAEKWQETAMHWGIKPGELERIPVGKRMELAKRLMETKKFQDVADLAGRFKNMVNAATATSYSHGQDEIVDITQGNDLSYMLPSELLKLEITPELFFKDLAEGKLLQYNLKGVEQMGRGPIIVCLDVSVSMTSGGADEWAKAVTLALMGLAEKQKRSFGFILFDAKVQESRSWPKANLTIEDKLQIAEISSHGGGTDFFLPLVEAFNMRNQTGDLKPADIVFITDGEYDFKGNELEEVLQSKQDVRIFGIQVGSSSVGPTMEKFCDHVALVNNGEIEVAREIINVASRDVKRRES